MTEEEAVKIVDGNEVQPSPVWFEIARTLRQALAEAQAERNALAQQLTDLDEGGASGRDFWMQAQAETAAERDALRRKLDAAMKVVEAAREAIAASDDPYIHAGAIDDALAALEADPT